MVPGAISDAVSAALHPNHFFVAPPATLRLEFSPSETIPWEVFRGHLLDASRTRQRRTFAAWHVFLDANETSEIVASGTATKSRATEPPPAPLVSIRWDATDRKLFVSRNILTQGWEAYEPQPGVVDSRPVRRWTPELIATISLDVFASVVRSDDSPPSLTEELEAGLALAWTGVSRLPITSVEAPLPDYALGRMAYFADRDLALPSDEPARCLLIHALENPAAPNSARRFEVSLRAAQPTDACEWLSGFAPLNRSGRETRPEEFVALVQSVFHHVSLTPYTQFAENLLIALDRFSHPDWLGPVVVLDLIGHLIRHLVRHLTAYDLVRFHSFGANYPDALWLDGLLKLWLSVARSAPDSVLTSADDDDRTRSAKRLRRRALRQGWLTRKAHEGHRVPDRPTSRGENIRVIPGQERMVPDEQITQADARRKQLYESDPTDRLFVDSVSRGLLAASLHDLIHPLELRESGTATFLDRPFGIFKASGEVDRTPMLAYEAFSREIARSRLLRIRDWMPSLGLNVERTSGLLFEAPELIDERLASCAPDGFPASELPGASRPGIIMLEDARVAAGDFKFLSTVRGSYERLAATPLGFTAAQAAAIRAWSATSVPSLLIRTAGVEAAGAGESWITRFQRRDNRLQIVDQICLAPTTRPIYAESLGVEFLANGVELRGPIGPKNPSGVESLTG